MGPQRNGVIYHVDVVRGVSACSCYIGVAGSACCVDQRVCVCDDGVQSVFHQYCGVGPAFLRGLELESWTLKNPALVPLSELLGGVFSAAFADIVVFRRRTRHVLMLCSAARCLGARGQRTLRVYRRR